MTRQREEDNSVRTRDIFRLTEFVQFTDFDKFYDEVLRNKVSVSVSTDLLI